MISSRLTRYRPRYVRSLVYMLQQSEYDIRDYLRWYHRVKSFDRVEKRKHLVKTPKALLLTALLWAILFGFVVKGILLIWFYPILPVFLVVALLFIAAPYLLAYAVIIPLLLIKFFLQKPIERILMFRARQTLRKHNAVKIAIAGSFGKTSMREILKTVLAEEKKVACPPHSYNTPLAISRFIQELRGDEDVLIFELGEYYPGDVRKLCGLIEPQLGIITGVNEAHLEKFKTLERTANTIFELADFLGEKPLYVNGESHASRAHTKACHIIYTRGGAGSNKIKEAHTDLTGTSFMLLRDGKEIMLKTALLGLHQVGPMAAAADIAEQLGISLEQIRQGLNKTKPFDHRLEPKTDAQGVTTLDDSYNGNPDGVSAVIEFLGSLKNHRRFYVTPGLVEMGPRIKEVHQNIGRLLAKAGIEKVILIKNSVTPFIYEGLKEQNYQGEITWFDDALAAFAALPQLTVAGDVVLLQNDWPDQYA